MAGPKGTSEAQVSLPSWAGASITHTTQAQAQVPPLSVVTDLRLVLLSVPPEAEPHQRRGQWQPRTPDANELFTVSTEVCTRSAGSGLGFSPGIEYTSHSLCLNCTPVAGHQLGSTALPGSGAHTWPLRGKQLMGQSRPVLGPLHSATPYPEPGRGCLRLPSYTSAT